MTPQIVSQISESLETACSFSAPAARGTIRLAIIEGGFRPQSVTSKQMAQVLEQVLPEMLSDRGIRHPANVCQDLMRNLDGTIAFGRADDSARR